jgi:hypothetical protein
MIILVLTFFKFIHFNGCIVDYYGYYCYLIDIGTLPFVCKRLIFR